VNVHSHLLKVRVYMHLVTIKVYKKCVYLLLLMQGDQDQNVPMTKIILFEEHTFLPSADYKVVAEGHGITF
jgi:hypothetical protein